jgi:predicted regulator of Ras-like GTPase activity (Roadblock/LC7/MglB family)
MSDPYAAALSGAAGRSLQLDQILATLLRQAPDVEAAAVVSFDGLPMASALPAGMDEDRVAAMSAALLSLGERAAQGLGRGDLSQVYVEGDNGTVFLVSADDEAVLVAVGRVGAKVGLMLFEVRQAADAVGASLRVDAAPVEPLVPQPVAQRVVEPVAQPVVEPVAQPVVEQVVVEQPVEQTHQQVEPQPAPQFQQPVEQQVEHRVEQPVPSVMPDPPVQAEPAREPVAVPVPRQVRESSWDMHHRDGGNNGSAVSNGSGASNGSHVNDEADERRPASVAPDGSAWS